MLFVRYSTCLKFQTEPLLFKLALCHAGHPGVDEGEVSEHRLVDAVDERPVDAGQPRLLVDKLFVEVAAVAGRRLQKDTRRYLDTCRLSAACSRMSSSECNYQSRPEGRRHLPLLQHTPVSGSEETVCPDVPLYPQALFRLPHQQLRHKRDIVSAFLLNSDAHLAGRLLATLSRMSLASLFSQGG